MKTLMFEIDEGIGGTELISVYQNDFAGLDKCLANIADGLAPLSRKFRLVVQIYPTWHYSEKGFGGDPAVPLNRISGALKHTFEFFKQRKIPVYLEIHSSGIRTNQNGELGELPPAPLHYGETEKMKSLPCDMEVLEALKGEYGDTFEGVRFHELVGSHEIGLHDRASGKEESSHAFVVQDRVIRGVIDTCKKSGLKLVWSDHMFNDVFERPEIFGCFKEWVDYAVEKLADSGQLTFNWANNGWPMHKYITGKFLLKDYKGAKTGMSVQSWFWQELDSSTMSVKKGESGFETKWYAYAEMECPIELMAIYTKKYLEEGCELIQFEPPHYFFNYYRPSKKLVKYRGLVEKKPDYTVRTHTKRFISMLLDDKKSTHLSSEITDYYDKDRELFVKNTVTEPAKRYSQCTIFALGGKIQAFDYINNGVSALENSEYRFNPSIFSGKIISVTRLKTGYSNIDDIAVLKLTKGKKILEIYNHRSGLMLAEKELFIDDANGRVVKIYSANLLSNYIGATDGDPDEIIAIRENGGKITFEAFAVEGISDSTEHKIKLKKLNSDCLNMVIPKAEGYSLTGLAAGLRLSNSVNADCTRNIEKSASYLAAKLESYYIINVCDGLEKIFRLKLGGEILDMAPADINFDLADEIALLIKEDNKKYIAVIDALNGTLLQKIQLIGNKAEILFTHRICSNSKNFEPQFRNLNNALI